MKNDHWGQEATFKRREAALRSELKQEAAKHRNKWILTLLGFAFFLFAFPKVCNFAAHALASVVYGDTSDIHA